MKDKEKWSLKYDLCVKCGRNDFKHIARGLCVKCYQKENEERNRVQNREKYGSAAEKLDFEFLQEEYVNKKRSLGDLAKECNCSRQYVYKKIMALNIPLRTKRQARELAYDRNKIVFKRVSEDGIEKLLILDKIRVNDNFFSSWSNKMAYLLGVVVTDGNLSPGSKLDPLSKSTTKTPRITISQKEPELLNKVLALMDCDAKLYYNNQPIYWFHINSEKIYFDLINLGLTPRKSLTIIFPDMPSEYVRHFIRGCWDGDGTVYIESKTRRIYAKYVSGSLKFTERLMRELEIAGMPKGKIYERISKNPAYYISYSGENCRILYHYLYEGVDSGQYLNRKYEVFKKYFGGLDRSIHHLKKCPEYIGRLRKYAPPSPSKN